MSESLSSPKPAGGIGDVKVFFKGLRSISLRNLTFRAPSAGLSGSKLDASERDSASVTSASLPNLRAEIVRSSKGSARDHSAGNFLLATGVAQSTVNPTWPVSQMAWLQAEAGSEDDLDVTRLMVLRVFAVKEEGLDATAAMPATLGANVWQDSSAAQKPLWEYVIDVRELMPLPAGSKLSQLRSLPADCLLLGMANGSLYSPGWVVEALEGSSALPPAIQGSSRGGAYVDAWRDDDDEDEDGDQEPLEVVYRKVLNMEEEARKERTELSAMLERSSAARQRVFDADKDDSMIRTLQEELAMQEALLEMEEASVEREKRHLQREAVAVEHLLDHVAEAERAILEDARQLQGEKAEMLKSQALLEARRARLTAELQAIYPIKYHHKSGEYSIRGLELPADLYSMDDERVSSALGYTAHLVCMLSKYLQVPLRYQLIYNASRSAVRDNVTGAGVAYPLFRRGVEKERFDKGVELFGRDVEQLLVARGVPIKRGGGQLLRNLERLMAIEGA